MTDYGTFTIQPKTSGPTEHAPAAARRSWIAEAWAWLVTTISNLFQARVVEARGPESAPRGLEGRASILSSSAESTDTHSDGVSIDSEEGSTSAQAGATRLNRSPSLEVILPKKTSRGEKIREEYLSVVRKMVAEVGLNPRYLALFAEAHLRDVPEIANSLCVRIMHEKNVYGTSFGETGISGEKMKKLADFADELDRLNVKYFTEDALPSRNNVISKDD